MANAFDIPAVTRELVVAAGLPADIGYVKSAVESQPAGRLYPEEARIRFHGVLPWAAVCSLATLLYQGRAYTGIYPARARRQNRLLLGLANGFAARESSISITLTEDGDLRSSVSPKGLGVVLEQAPIQGPMPPGPGITPHEATSFLAALEYDIRRYLGHLSVAILAQLEQQYAAWRLESADKA
ncbi:hypothetical protein [Halomonas sp. LBP4]|uniref:hypothetical protein n=1 Tax=Halomonas sp. LBP4 TaxID=2044917 RepID=UPI000D77115B|nr:hypothetical protein [Halomonas sp. LBP4]PXX95894.1 hypothetical protein CR157_16980 [Halomonas sp. LBP4]